MIFINNTKLQLLAIKAIKRENIKYVLMCKLCFLVLMSFLIFRVEFSSEIIFYSSFLKKLRIQTVYI